VISQDRLYSIIGEQLRSHREQQDLTQAQLAEKVGLERTSITNIEKGKQKLPLHVLFGICDTLGVSAADVLPRVEEISEAPVTTHATLGAYEGVVPLGVARILSGESV